MNTEQRKKQAFRQKLSMTAGLAAALMTSGCGPSGTSYERMNRAMERQVSRVSDSAERKPVVDDRILYVGTDMLGQAAKEHGIDISTLNYTMLSAGDGIQIIDDKGASTQQLIAQDGSIDTRWGRIAGCEAMDITTLDKKVEALANASVQVTIYNRSPAATSTDNTLVAGYCNFHDLTPEKRMKSGRVPLPKNLTGLMNGCGAGEDARYVAVFIPRGNKDIDGIMAIGDARKIRWGRGNIVLGHNYTVGFLSEPNLYKDFRRFLTEVVGVTGDVNAILNNTLGIGTKANTLGLPEMYLPSMKK